MEILSGYANAKAACSRRTLLRTLYAGVLATMLVLAGLGQCRAQMVTPAEYQVKAAFLYKFVGYVEWPPQAFARADSPLVIGVVGADALAEVLEQMVANRTINGRPLVIRRLRHGEPVNGLHVLFVSGADARRAGDMLASARGQAILTVTESEQAPASGSVINFVIVDDKVRFDIALGAAELGSLKISARLLGVARKVSTGSS
jgi:hypothetical protein